MDSVNGFDLNLKVTFLRFKDIVYSRILTWLKALLQIIYTNRNFIKLWKIEKVFLEDINIAVKTMIKHNMELKTWDIIKISFCWNSCKMMKSPNVESILQVKVLSRNKVFLIAFLVFICFSEI